MSLHRTKGRWIFCCVGLAGVAAFCLPATFSAASDEAEAQPTFSARPGLYARATSIWPFAKGPLYGDPTLASSEAAGVLHTAVGSFDLTRGEPAFSPQLRTGIRLDSQPDQHFVLQVDPKLLDDGSCAAVQESIEAAGGVFLRAMPVAAWIVRLDARAYKVALVQPLLALQPWHPGYRLSPAIGTAPLPDAARALSDTYDLDIRVFPLEDAASVARSVEALGGRVISVWPDLVRAEVHRDRLAALAGLEAVEMVLEHMNNLMKGEETTLCIQTGPWTGAAPYNDAGVDGGGNGITGTSAQRLMVLDNGIQLDAGDLSATRTDAGAAGPIHRKVALYTSTNAFGGSGDLLGCDAMFSGGYTHGHIVAATALGNATKVNASYGGGWTIPGGGPRALDGVAPGAMLLAYDAQITPTNTSCDDPALSGLFVGNIYSRASAGSCPGCGSLKDASNRLAHTFVLGWGSILNPVYGSNAAKVDEFLYDNKDSMLFVAAGNEGPEENSVSDPATSKNAVTVGATYALNAGHAPDPDQEDRWPMTSIGPATAASGRVAPLIMAPGADFGISGRNMGSDSEYACASGDNDQLNLVACDYVDGKEGTSFAGAAVAGAALLVRDWFQQGFYPDGDSGNPGNAADQVLTLSGALVKAVLVASADWVGEGNNRGDNLDLDYRFNDEQGYGRVQLSNVLPLRSLSSSPPGIIVADGGMAGGRNDTTLSGTALPSQTEGFTFRVCDNAKELRLALAWIEDSGEFLTKNLDLELVSPSGRMYYGNYFTDDDDRDGVINPATENCDYAGGAPWPPASTGARDAGPWSIPVCANSDRDSRNPTEAIFLSPDPAWDGVADNPATASINEGVDNQIETGTWTVRVRAGSFSGTQRYALVISGGTCNLSTILLGPDEPACNDSTWVTVLEEDSPSDPAPALTPAEISGRTALLVVNPGPDGVPGNADDVVVDQLSGLLFSQPDPAVLRFEAAPAPMSEFIGPPNSGDGVLSVAHGLSVRAIYQDKTGGVPDPNKQRTAITSVECRMRLAAGVVAQFGRDASYGITGGCEKDGGGRFANGFPDRYMDAGEIISYQVSVRSQDTQGMPDVEVSLRAVQTDGDSPASCSPGSSDCADPDRLNNPPSPYLTIFDSPKSLGPLPAGQVATAAFAVQVLSSLTGTSAIEMVLGARSPTSGRTDQSVHVSRHILNVDELSYYYSTDFPTGGTEIRDFENNEVLQDPNAENGFETIAWSSLTETGRNTGINAPWNFENISGAFTTGVSALSTSSLANPPALWGEDKNFNNVLDPGEDRAGVNGVLDQNWSTNGGCGWQSKGALSTGGVWHTGLISPTGISPMCLANPGTTAQCTRFGTIPGTSGSSRWWELLLTPQVSKIHQCLTGSELGCNGQVDAPGDPVFKMQFIDWAWNVALDLPDRFARFTWELDTDTASSNSVDLINDPEVLGSLTGPLGPTSGGAWPLTQGYPLFAPISKCLDTDGNGSPDHCGFRGGVACTSDAQCTGLTVNGALGGNRSGRNNCSFEGKTGGVVNAKIPFGLPGPADDDVDNGYCDRAPGDPLQGIDKSRSCAVDADCTPPYVVSCIGKDSSVDSYVFGNGPLRNMSVARAGGPDMRIVTLEDLAGEPGTTFQGAFGFEVHEGTAGEQPVAGFGVAVDDVALQWREYTLVEDQTACSSTGQCAVVQADGGWRYAASARIGFTVLDATPYDPVTPKNDCNGDGDYSDIGRCSNPDAQGQAVSCTSNADCVDYGVACNADLNYADDTDCNNNAIPDVTLRVVSQAEPSGEVVVLDRASPSGSEYRGSVATSAHQDQRGVVFVQNNGTDTPTVIAVYIDRHNGTDSACGTVDSGQSPVAVVVPDCRLVIQSARLTDNGDDDGFADTSETVNLYVTLANASGAAQSNVVARLQTTDTKIECVQQPAIEFGTLAGGESVEGVLPFVFTVSAGASRASLTQDFSAPFTVTFSSNECPAAYRPQSITLDLDLDVSGGGAPTTYIEGFEVPTGLASLSAMSLDTGRNTNLLSDGLRCQSTDPDSPDSNTFGNTACYLGFQDTSKNAFDWHVHQTSSPDGGRAFVGSRSLHFGEHRGSAEFDTIRLSQMDAVRTTNPISLDLTGTSDLSFTHQVSLGDSRVRKLPAGETLDRGVVQAQLVDATGAGVGNWMTLTPYKNLYDEQGAAATTSCLFDPIDDGNTEDSLVSYPKARGPASTCYPSAVFAHMGDTDYRNSFDATKLGNAEGPGLQGSLGAGTWVESRFSLSRFRGRGLRIRFLASTHKEGETLDYVEAGAAPNESADDGWFIDDVRISGALSMPAVVSVDTNTNPGLPVCPAACTMVNATLVADPPVLNAPGHMVTLSAAGSTADRCSGGALQYRFWIDSSGNGVVGDAGDVLLRDWTDNALLDNAPTFSTRYGVEARCGSATSCSSSHTALVTVPCPGGCVVSLGVLSNGMLYNVLDGQGSFADSGTFDFDIQSIVAPGLGFLSVAIDLDSDSQITQAEHLVQNQPMDLLPVLGYRHSTFFPLQSAITAMRDVYAVITDTQLADIAGPAWQLPADGWQRFSSGAQSFSINGSGTDGQHGTPPPAGPPAVTSSVPKASLDTPVERDIPQKTMECGPTSSAESLIWLAERDGWVNRLLAASGRPQDGAIEKSDSATTPSTDEDALILKLRDAMVPTNRRVRPFDGLDGDELAIGKAKFANENRLPIEIHGGMNDPSAKGAKAFEFAQKEKEKGQDVEYLVFWQGGGAHWVKVVGTAVNGDELTLSVVNSDDGKGTASRPVIEHWKMKKDGTITAPPNAIAGWAAAESPIIPRDLDSQYVITSTSGDWTEQGLFRTLYADPAWENNTTLKVGNGQAQGFSKTVLLNVEYKASQASPGQTPPTPSITVTTSTGQAPRSTSVVWSGLNRHLLITWVLPDQPAWEKIQFPDSSYRQFTSIKRLDVASHCKAVPDCNKNHVDDRDDIQQGTSQDTNANSVPDTCDQGDCNTNGIQDILDIADGASLDCDQDGRPDSCDAGDPQTDCDMNGVPDSCDTDVDGGVLDCNGNRVPDVCDIARGTSTDGDFNGIPDECQCNPPTCDDGDPCTDDTCDPMRGCWHAAIPLPPELGDNIGVTNTPEGALIAWPDASGPFNVYRGLRSGSGTWSYDQECFLSNVTSPVEDASLPTVGDSFYYLVSRRTMCGESFLGRDSSGTVIPNTSPCQ